MDGIDDVAGRYDEDTPLRTATEPLMKPLSDPKRLALYEGGHVPSVEVLMSTMSPWLEEQLAGSPGERRKSTHGAR